MANGIVRCDQCGLKFEKKNREINWARKCGYKIFCSGKCRKKAQCRAEVSKCLACGCDISIIPSRISKSNTGKFYCGSSCAARMRNLGSHKTDEEKHKISRALFGKSRDGGNSWTESTCVVCGKKFSHPVAQNRQSCSVSCSRIVKFGSLPYTKEETVDIANALIMKIGKAPSSKLVESKLVVAARRFFGSWNKLIKELGCKPNTQWVRFKPICRDGHKADSISEMLVDNWMFGKGIQHERHKKYPEGKYTCDFYLPESNLWVEYFGIDNRSWYRETMEIKKDMAKRYGLNLVGIHPYDLYPEMNLEKLILR